MKNSVLAPIAALLLLLAVSWGGLFGLAHGSAAADPGRAATGSTRTTSDTGTPRGDSGRNSGTSRADEGDGSFLDRFGHQDDRVPSSSRDTTADGTGTTRHTGSGDRTSDDGEGLQAFLERVADRDGTDTTSGRAAHESRDPAGLTNRGAAVLLLVIVLIAVANGRNK